MSVYIHTYMHIYLDRPCRVYGETSLEIHMYYICLIHMSVYIHTYMHIYLGGPCRVYGEASLENIYTYSNICPYTYIYIHIYLGGPCRVYGEASLEKTCVILEVALIPSLKITSMKGFVESTDMAEHAALPALVALNSQVSVLV